MKHLAVIILALTLIGCQSEAQKLEAARDILKKDDFHMTQAELGQYKEQLDAMGLSMTVQKDYPLIYFTMRLKEFGKGDIPKGEIKKFENDLGTSLCEGLESKVAELGSKERKNLKYVTQVMEADGAGVNVVLKDKYGQTLVDTTKKFSDCPNFRQIKAS